jgi:hypothetical protein
VSTKKGAKADLLRIKKSGRPRTLYIDAFLGRGIGGAQYSLSIRR